MIPKGYAATFKVRLMRLEAEKLNFWTASLDSKRNLIRLTLTETKFASRSSKFVRTKRNLETSSTLK